MSVLDNKVPPPLLFFMASCTTWFSALYSPRLELNTTITHLVSISLLVIGIAFCVTGMISFHREKTTINPLKPETTTSLVTSGVYSFSRNPMYLGLALALLSFSVYLRSPSSIIGFIFFVLYINRFQIKPEEKHLYAIFGGGFVQYTQTVRKWL